MKFLKIVPQLIVILILLQSCSEASHWNQYLGPDRNATISGVDILQSWSDKGPRELWSFPLGEGYGGAAIYGEEVFILDRLKGESDIMRCLDLNTGEEKWTYSYEAKGEIPFPGSEQYRRSTRNTSGVWGPMETSIVLISYQANLSGLIVYWRNMIGNLPPGAYLRHL